jgi:beta-mannanase
MVVVLAALVGMVAMATPTYGVPATTTPTVPVTGTSVGPPARASGALTPPVVPAAGTAYLGAFVDPSGQELSGAAPLGGTSGVATELASLSSVEPGLGRPLSIVEVDQSWSDPVDIAQLRRVAGTGAIPMITWECGDTDANVIAGADDALITRFAHELSSLGAPVMVRWFPDANGSGSATQSCLGAGGAADYVAAFQHIQRLLTNAGATNAATVWSVDTSPGSSPDWAGFYPGASSADWIAADDESPTAGPDDPGGVSSAFSTWYSTFSTYGKPLLISNTGTTPGAQGQFLSELSSELPTQYPLIKGVVYLDAPQAVTQTQLAFDPNGLAAFRSLSRSPYFQPARSPSSTSIGTTGTRVARGQLVSITGSVSAPDLGGAVTYFVNGSAVTGCSYLPITVTAGCNTSTLPPGTDSVVAAYSGDTAFQPSTSAPLSVIVAPTSAPTSSVPVASAMARLGGQAHAGVVGSDDPACTAASPAASSGPGVQPAVPGPCQAYLGASVDPTGTTLSEPDALAALDQGLGRPASIVQLDQAWNAPVNATQLEQAYATGAIPMVTWSCGDLDSHVTNGDDDATITAAAQTMASTGVPILLQWFPDPGSFPGNSSECLGNLGAAGYVQAYRAIVRQFRSAGADNVAFVWSVDTNDSPSSAWNGYYPGSGFVDWIAADGFDRSTSPPTVGQVQNLFGAWYSAFSSLGKPLMISDTGAIAGQEPSVQTTYLNLLGSMLPTDFPLVKALVYQDGRAPGPTGDPYDFTLDPGGQSAFDSLSAGPYFQPDQLATTTTVSVSDASPPQGKVVTITAAVAGSDQGGSVSFVDNGSPLPGCDDVQVLNASSCETSSLPEGTNDLTADYLGDAAYGPSESAPVRVTVSPAVGEQGRPYIPPVGTAYLGAWVRPLPVTKLTPVNQELSVLPTFNAGLGRSLSVVHVYQNWTSPTPTAELQQVLANGATPMIDWRCGPSDATILSGQDDAYITSFATELAQLKAPVFLRWFYEFNFPNSPDYKACIGSLGPAGYAAAFRHIHALFTAAGASNVSFVWCIAAGGQDQDWINYYPGPAYVDWIAVDGYLRNEETYQPGQFAQLFGPWYSTFDSFGKPMMITETATLSGAQGSYLADIKQSLDNGYPMIRGLLYFDAPGKGGTYSYPLGASGYSAFQSLANDRRFEPPREPSATSVTVSTASAVPAEAVHISAAVDSDYGGSVSLFSNGSPVTGCQQMPVATNPGCTTVSLPAGSDALTAVYNGDAEFGQSVSAPVRVQLAPLFGADPSASPLPPLSGVPLLGEFSLPLTTKVFSARPAMTGATDGTPDGLDLWGLLLGRDGYGWVGILAGVLLMIIGGSYMLVTWVKDEQLKRRLSRP